MDYWSSVYNSPEKHGLEVVAEIDYSDGDYCFDMRVIWKHTETKKYYTARDAGCSCPSPFEDFRKLEDLDPLSPDAIREEANTDDNLRHVGAFERRAFLDKLNAIEDEIRAS